MVVGLPIYNVEPCPFEVMTWHSPCGIPPTSSYIMEV
jgi:hypothetical protein